MCCRPWGHKESETTEQLNWTDLSSLQWWQFSFLSVSFYLFSPKSTWHLCSSHCLLNDFTSSSDVFKSFQNHVTGSLHLVMLGFSLVDLSFLEWLWVCFCQVAQTSWLWYPPFDCHTRLGVFAPTPAFYLNLIPGGISPETLSIHWAGEQSFSCVISAKM